jgi:hypothetical protein
MMTRTMTGVVCISVGVILFAVLLLATYDSVTPEETIVNPVDVSIAVGGEWKEEVRADAGTIAYTFSIVEREPIQGYKCVSLMVTVDAESEMSLDRAMIGCNGDVRMNGLRISSESSMSNTKKELIGGTQYGTSEDPFMYRGTGFATVFVKSDGSDEHSRIVLDFLIIMFDDRCLLSLHSLTSYSDEDVTKSYGQVFRISVDATENYIKNTAR